MSCQTCYIGLLALPGQFSYRPVTPPKRFKVVQTMGAVKIHGPGGYAKIPADGLVEGDGILGWKIPKATRAEWIFMRQFYEAYVLDEPQQFGFSGYWGDIHQIIHLVMDPPTVRSTHWDLSGSFRVISTSSYGVA